MSDLDLNRLVQAQVILTSVAALSNVPAWNVPLAIVGLVVVPGLSEGGGAESVRQWVLALGGSVLLDFIWFVGNSTHGLARVLIIVNWLLKIVTVLSALTQLRARGEGSFGFQASGFSIPGGLADRIPNSFPPFGQRQQGSEEVWSAPPPTQQHSSTGIGGYQPRFSLDEEASAGSSTPPVQQQQPAAPASSGKKSAAGGGGGKKGGEAGVLPTAAEGGGYHTLE
ncbi:uncharacterized protein JCM10292_004483 [Rhodotorula paludigena]|uniref:uncharacterized protein n=1 Tax=Rhodotorula paludigena TaxID=86838 RepID=UPI00316D3785